jgi:hypothetical protein
MESLAKHLSLSSQKYGFGIRDPKSGIRDQGSKRHRIPDPDLQPLRYIFHICFHTKKKSEKLIFIAGAGYPGGEPVLAG